jgi:hypothetical protein
MKPYEVLYGLMFVLVGMLSVKGYPLAGMLVVAAVFLAGTAAVLTLRWMVTQHCDCSKELSNSAALAIIEALLGPDQRGNALPSFVSVGKGGGQYLGDLYRNPLFQFVCQVIRVLGPVPCYPAYSWLARRK